MRLPLHLPSTLCLRSPSPFSSSPSALLSKLHLSLSSVYCQHLFGSPPVRRNHTDAAISDSLAPHQDSPFRLLRVRKTWTVLTPPVRIEEATQAARERKWFAPAPRFGEWRKSGVGRRGISAFWAKTAASRMRRGGISDTQFQAGQPTLLGRSIRGKTQATTRRQKGGVALVPADPAQRWLKTLGATPTTEESFYLLIQRLCRTDLVQPASIVAFHQHPFFSLLASSRTYGQILQRCFRAGNFRLTQRVLELMDVRQIPWDAHVLDALLKTHLRRGNARGVQDMTSMLRRTGRQTPEPLLNWRRDLGEAFSGKGDRWKIWTSSKGLATRAKVDAEDEAKRAEVAQLPTPFNSHKVYTDGDYPLARQETAVPNDVVLLHSSEATALLESLSQDLRGSEALEIAEAWLDAARPPAESPRKQYIFPRYMRQSMRAKRYNATGVVMLNILLKCLFVRDLPIEAVQDFVLYFVERHAIGDGNHGSEAGKKDRLRPNTATLDTLLRGVSATHPQKKFVRAVAVVNWFGVEFDLPPRLIDFTASRTRQAFPSIDLKDPVAVENPVCHVSSRVASLLLRQAIETHEAFPSEGHVAVVRKWWSLLDKSGAGWIDNALRQSAIKAGDAGLLDKTALWGRRVGRPSVRTEGRQHWLELTKREKERLEKARPKSQKEVKLAEVNRVRESKAMRAQKRREGHARKALEGSSSNNSSKDAADEVSIEK